MTAKQVLEQFPVYVVVACYGGILNCTEAYTSERRAIQRANTIAKNFGLPVRGENKWHSEEHDVWIVKRRINLTEAQHPELIEVG